LDFRLQPAAVGQPVEDDFELGRAERLQQVIERARAEGLDRVVDRALPGDDDPFAVRVLLPGRAQDFDAVSVGQVDVHDQEARVELLERLRALLAGADRARVHAEVPDRFFQAPPGRQVVFDDQDLHGLSSGTRTVVATRSPDCSTRTVPPDAAHKRRALARPMPQAFPGAATRGEKSDSGSPAGSRPGFSTRTSRPPSDRATATETAPAEEASRALIRTADNAS